MLCAKRAIVTVEEIVDTLDAPMNSVVLPSWVVGAVCEVKRGAFPSYALGYYQRNNAFYKTVGRHRARARRAFKPGSTEHVMNTKDIDGFLKSLEQAVAHG